MMLLSHFIVIVKFKKSRRQKLHEKVPKYITAEIYYRRNLKPPKYTTNKVSGNSKSQKKGTHTNKEGINNP